MTTRLQLTWRGAAGGDEASPRLHQPPPRREVILGLQREVAEPAGGHLLPPEQQEQLVSVAHTVVLHRGVVYDLVCIMYIYLFTSQIPKAGKEKLPLC